MHAVHNEKTMGLVEANAESEQNKFKKSFVKRLTVTKEQMAEMEAQVMDTMKGAKTLEGKKIT